VRPLLRQEPRQTRARTAPTVSPASTPRSQARGRNDRQQNRRTPVFLRKGAWPAIPADGFDLPETPGAFANCSEPGRSGAAHRVGEESARLRDADDLVCNRDATCRTDSAEG